MTASNKVATTASAQRRMDYQASASLDGLLKDVYIPALNNVTFHATPLLEMFGEFGGTIDFAANKIIKAFKTQGAGGFGGISEGGDWVKHRDQKGFQGWDKIKYLNAYVALTGPAARTVKEGGGGYVDAISSAMDDTLKLARMQMERIVGGNGDGAVAAIGDIYSEGRAVANGHYARNTDEIGTETYNAAHHQLTALAAYGGYSPVQWLANGLRVNLIDEADFDGDLGDGEALGPFEVGHVDYAEGKFSLKNVSGASINLNDVTNKYIIVLENAYGERYLANGTNDYTETGSNNLCLEPNGLYNLVHDSGSIWNTTRSSQPHALKSTVIAAGGAELDEELVMGWILDLVNIKQNTPNVLVTDPKSRLKYFSNRKEDRRFDMTVIDSKFGFRSTGVVIDQYELALQSLTSLKPGTLFMLNTGDFKFVKATGGFQWVTGDGGGVFRQKETSDNLYATAVNYTNFVCENPNGQLKATGLSY